MAIKPSTFDNIVVHRPLTVYALPERRDRQRRRCFEAAVVAVPDDRWDERPLACVVLESEASATATELRDFLADRVAKWWLPERWAFIQEVPKTSVGKFDKKVLRARHESGELQVESL